VTATRKQHRESISLADELSFTLLLPPPPLLLLLLHLQGQSAITAQRTGSRRAVKNSIHFEVTWTSRNKRKSIYMRKPPHYLVYQLTLDIEAHTGIRADTQLLILYGRLLQPLQRLSSCN
jgi:hypothetical protein